MKHLYFAYGSNTHLKQMEQSCPGAVNLGPAYLQDYRLLFRIHADIELCEHSTVAGVLWEIDDNHLASLDRYEGFPAYYLRHRVFVKTTADEPKWVAWVYSMTEQEEELSPGKPYYNVCMEGYVANGIETTQLEEALKH